MYDPTLNTTCITFINFEEFEPGDNYILEFRNRRKLDIRTNITKL